MVLKQRSFACRTRPRLISLSAGLEINTTTLNQDFSPVTQDHERDI